MSKSLVDYDEIWGEVNSQDFVNVTPTNEHDRHSVRNMIALIYEAQNAINNPEQWGVNQDQARIFEDKLRQMRVLLAEECKIARRVDPKVPVLREQGGRWRVHPREN